MCWRRAPPDSGSTATQIRRSLPAASSSWAQSERRPNLFRRFQQRKDHGHHVVGVVVDKHTDETIEGIPVAGPSADTLQAVANTGATTVAIAAWSHLSQADVRRLVCSLGDTDVDIVVAPNVDEVSHSRLAVNVSSRPPPTACAQARIDRRS